MKTLCALASSLLFTMPCGARIGETMAELKLRYGAPLNAEGAPEAPTSRWTFHDRHYVILVTVRKNRSTSEEFTRRDRRDFTLEEVRDLLAEGALPGAAWNQVNPKTWRDNERVATWFDRTLLLTGPADGD